MAGKNVNVLVKSGTVKVKLPGPQALPDAVTRASSCRSGRPSTRLKGRVTLVAAGGQTADFYAGIFKIGQGKGVEAD